MEHIKDTLETLKTGADTERKTTEQEIIDGANERETEAEREMIEKAIKQNEEQVRKATSSEAQAELTDEQRTENERKQLEAELSAMNLHSLDHTFERFNQLVKGTREAFGAFKALATGETDKPLLLCCGGVGNGKTHLCEALVIQMRKRGYLTRYNKVVQILRIFKSAMGDDTGMPPVDELIARFAEARVLILDDYGIEYGSRWEQSVIEDLIDERYRARRITVLCTNLDISELPERIASRFSDPEVAVKVLNEGADYRKRIVRK